MTSEVDSLWFEMSGALFRRLIPKEIVEPALRGGLTAAEHTFLAHRETKRVDDALIAMALAAGEEEVKAIFAELSNDTIIALASRWARYMEEWRSKAKSGELHQWIPPKQQDMWRAIYLSLVADQPAQTAAAIRLWKVVPPG